jgi:hypothetical protein
MAAVRRLASILALLALGLAPGVCASSASFLGSAIEGTRVLACQRIGAKLGSVSVESCLDSGVRPTGGVSVEGSPILMREYPPLAGRRPLGRVLLVGGIHGDEYSAVSIVFKWMEMLDQFHSGIFHWRVAPVLNPDGLLLSSSQRMNSNGVDLNRNFPTPDWHTATTDYWVRQTSRNPRRFPGTGPLSEPESRWLAAEIERFRPDVLVSVHAPHNVLDFDGPPEPPEQLGPLRLHLLGTYPGSLGRWAGVHMGLPVVTIELPRAGSMPTVSEQKKIWVDLVAWLRHRLTEQPRPEWTYDALSAGAGGSH